MKNQIRSLDSKGTTATLVSKSTTPDDGSAVEQTLHEGGYQIIFFSPEALLGEEVWRATQVYQKIKHAWSRSGGYPPSYNLMCLH